MAVQIFKSFNSASSKSIIHISDWIDENEKPIIENGILAKTWSPSSNLIIYKKITVDLKSFIDETKLEYSDVIRFSNSWYSSGTNIRESNTNPENKFIKISKNNQILEINSSIEVPGHLVSDKIQLSSKIILVNKINDNNLSASITGSVLWEDFSEVSLEGSNSLFPIESIIFPQKIYNANWYLSISPDLNSKITSGIKLYLNQSKKLFLEEILKDPKFLNLIYLEIIKQIIVHALKDDEFQELKQIDLNYYEPDTIGSMTMQIISRLKDTTPSNLSKLYDDEPFEFDKILQHYFLTS